MSCAHLHSWGGGWWPQVTGPAMPPPCLVAALLWKLPFRWRLPLLPLTNSVSPFSVLRQNSLEEISTAFQLITVVLKMCSYDPNQNPLGSCEADQLNQILWWWWGGCPGLRISQAFSGAGSMLKWEKNYSGIYVPAEQGLCRIALVFPVALARGCTADGSGEFDAAVNFLGRKGE